MANSDELATLLELAESGEQPAIEQFLYAFLEKSVYCPDRYQAQPLSDQPQYPNELFYLLGIKSAELQIIPVFTDPELITAWCGLPLTFKKLTGLELLKVAPEDWWISINPGSEVCKEFSPWEIATLKSGADSVPEVVEEILGDYKNENLKIRPIKDDELKEIQSLLIEQAKLNSSVSNVYILMQEGTQETLMIGIVTSKLAEDKQKLLYDDLDRALKPLLIGEIKTRIFMCDADHSDVNLKLFSHFTPIFSS